MRDWRDEREGSRERRAEREVVRERRYESEGVRERMDEREVNEVTEGDGEVERRGQWGRGGTV
jgi:hypothetical protein